MHSKDLSKSSPHFYVWKQWQIPEKAWKKSCYVQFLRMPLLFRAIIFLPRKITHSKLSLHHEWQAKGCSLKESAPIPWQKLGVSWFCCSWQPSEPFNTEYFIWVIFVNSSYPRPGISPLTSPDVLRLSTEFKCWKW